MARQIKMLKRWKYGDSILLQGATYTEGQDIGSYTLKARDVDHLIEKGRAELVTDG